MEQWKTAHLHAFIRIMTQELLRSIEGNDLNQAKDIANQIQALNTVADEKHIKLEKDFATLKTKYDDNCAKIISFSGIEKKMEALKVESGSSVSIVLSNENKKLRNDIKTLKNELDECKAKIARLETDKDDHENKLNPQLSEGKYLEKRDPKNKIEALKAKLKQKEKELNDSESRFFGSKVRINVLENENKNLRMEIGSLKDQTQSYEYEQLKAKYLKLENEFKDVIAMCDIYAKDAKESN